VGIALENPGPGNGIAAALGAGADPIIGFLQLLQIFQQTENTRIQVASLERALEIYKVYAEGGASSGISQLQVDQIDQQLNQARGQLVIFQQNYRNALDQFRYQIGMPPDVPVIPDVALIAPFRESFREILAWQARPDHTPEELPGIIRGLPNLENISLDDRPLFDFADPDRPKAAFADPEKLEEFLLTSERIALESRLDLMNQRAALYDTWRQLAVTANALLPVFNVNLNYQLFTPAVENNPFGFNSRSNQFNLAWNIDLPLVRLAERNAFRTAIITYQRQRRSLMAFEDGVKFSVRQDVRNLLQFAENYQINKTNLIVVLRQRDQALQQIIAPPDQAAGGGGGNVAANQATQTLNFINSITTILTVQNNLIQFWTGYETQRMNLYSDLGTMPYDEWEAYYELFPASVRGAAPVAGGGGAPNAARGGNAAAASAPEGRSS
jgi:outer membrane protein TolC